MELNAELKHELAIEAEQRRYERFAEWDRALIELDYLDSESTDQDAGVVDEAIYPLTLQAS